MYILSPTSVLQFWQFFFFQSEIPNGWHPIKRLAFNPFLRFDHCVNLKRKKFDLLQLDLIYFKVITDATQCPKRG